MANLQLILFGAPRLLRVRSGLSGEDVAQPDAQDAEQLKLSRRKAMALLAYLAVTGKPQARESLAALLWPDNDTALAYSYLRRELAILNKTLGQDVLEADRESVRLLWDSVWLDVAHFRQLSSQGPTHDHPKDEVCPLCLPPLAEAVDLYHDAFMAGFSLTGSQNFTEWQYFEREDLHHGLMGAFDKLVQGYGNLGNFEEAIRYARRWLSFESYNEAAHRRLMQLYAWTGNQVAAINQYQECVRVLAQEVGQQPEADTHALHQAIKSQALPAWKPPADNRTEKTSSDIVDADPDQSLGTSAPQHNLPPDPTPFFGREAELAQIVRLLLKEPACRMVTLMGPGGIGKTRLAIQSARQALDGFPNGSYLVNLASISSTRLIIPTIADALDLSFEGRSDLKARLINYLRQKKMLLVLDNFEQLLAASVAETSENGQSSEDILADILISAPHVKLLVTSRERLNLREEWILEIEGLTYPTATDAGHTEATGNLLETYSAVKLFVETARRTQPGFSISDANQAAVVEICQLVEGMPLGIELASAWSGLLPLQELVQEIYRNLDFLTSSMRNVPDRHRSLRALFVHSWQLLSELERQLISKLSVFQGSFSRAAAVRVADASLLLLKSLIDKSMLRGSPAGRYEMHEIIRQYAAEKLKESPETDKEVRARHARHYAQFLKQQESGLLMEQRQPLAEIAVRIDNVSTAWQWAVTHNRIAEIRQSLVSLHLFYYGQGWLQEGEAAFRQAAECIKKTISSGTELVLGQLFTRHGHFTYRLGLHRQAKKLLTDGLAIFRQHADDGSSLVQRETALALYYLSAAIRVDGEYDQARRLCQESLAIYRAGNNRRGMAHTLKLLGIIAGTTGNYEEAQRQFRQALELYQNLDDQDGVANSLNDLGIVADRLGEYAEAKRLHQQCLTIRRQTGNLWGVGISLNNLGMLALDQGEYAEARDLLQESLAIQEELGDQYQIANCLANLGAAQCALGTYDEARYAFVKGLKFAIEIGAVPLTLEILAGIAALLAAVEPAQTERAVTLFAFVENHPGSETFTKNKAKAGLAELANQLSPQALAAARAAGKASQLDMVAAELVGEMDRSLA